MFAAQGAKSSTSWMTLVPSEATQTDQRNMMPKLILIKHAAPVVAPGVPPEEWTRSDKVKHACTPLAEATLPFAPAVVVASLEPKAAETGEIVAARLGVPCETAAGLHEHDRSNFPHMPSW